MTRRQEIAQATTLEKLEKQRTALETKRADEDKRRQLLRKEQLSRKPPKHELTWKEVQEQEAERRRDRKEKHLQESLQKAAEFTNTFDGHVDDRPRKNSREAIVAKITAAEKDARNFQAEDPKKVTFIVMLSVFLYFICYISRCLSGWRDKNNSMRSIRKRGGWRRSW